MRWLGDIGAKIISRMLIQRLIILSSNKIDNPNNLFSYFYYMHCNRKLIIIYNNFIKITKIINFIIEKRLALYKQ